jgi:hypothetical protein
MLISEGKEAVYKTWGGKERRGGKEESKACFVGEGGVEGAGRRLAL